MSRLGRPSGILFDVGNTLLEERAFDLEAGIAAVLPNARAVGSLALAFRAQAARYHERQTELLLADWLRHEVPELSAEPLAAIEDRIWHAVVTLVPRPHVDTVLAELANDGVPMGAVSNAPFSARALRNELARHGLAEHLQFVLSSADTRARKPAPAIFDAALARLGVPAEHTWFVGDTFDDDIAGATAAHMQAILFAPSGRPRDLSDEISVVRDWLEFRALYGTT